MYIIYTNSIDTNIMNVEQLSEDGTILPKYVGVIKDYTTAYTL
jgi:hypothetical protein